MLAGGSNVVVADEGFPGAGPAGAHPRRRPRRAPRCEVAAGEPWDALVAGCVAGGLAGVECLAGIPGSVGATPIQNVGAYGQEVAETIAAVRVLDRADGAVARSRRRSAASPTARAPSSASPGAGSCSP